MKENTFDKHFEKPDSLQELLDDDLIITEFKNQNPKLMEYINVKEFKELIDYIIIEPKDDKDQKRAFRYPFYSCELLCCDNVKVMDMFFSKEEDSVDDLQVNDTKAEQNQEQQDKQDKLAKRQTSIDTDIIMPTIHTKKIQEDKPEVEPEVKNEQQETQEEQQVIDEEMTPSSTPVPTPTTAPEELPLIRSDDIFIYFCSFITDIEGKLNDILAGYFCRVFNNIFQRKQEEVIKSLYNQQNLPFINKLVTLVDSRSLAEILLKIISFEKNNNEESYLQEKLIIIKNLINLFQQNGASNFEIGANIQMIVQDLCSKAYAISNGKEILQYLLSPEIFGILVELQTNKNTYLSIPASTIVHSLLLFSLNDDIKNVDDDDGDSLTIDSSDAFTSIASNYSVMFEYLQATTINKNENLKISLGQTKIKLVEILQIVLRNKQEEPKLLLVDSDLFGTLNPLLSQYPFNNFFHFLYHKIITSIIEQDIKELINNMFEKNNLVNFLSNLTEGTKPIRSEDKSIFRRGYLGFIIQIGKFLEDYSLRNPNMKDRLVSPEWEKFKDQFFTRALSDNEQDLGGLSNNRDQGNTEAQFDFNRQDIENRYSGFLNNNPSSPPLQQDIEQFTEQNQDQVVSEATTNNIFESFGSSNFGVSDQSQGGFTVPVSASFDGFNNVGWSQQENTQEQVGWDTISKENIIQSNNQLTIELYWKVESSYEIQEKAFLEFESNQ